MVRSKRTLTGIALFSILAVVLAACGGSSGSSGASKTTGTTKAGGTVPKADAASGTLTVGAEQDAACADWINQCASSSWGAYMMAFQTMPRVFDFVKQGDDFVEVPNPLMAGAPTAATVNGKQVVTYPISPNAVWSDGQPITSTDFKYTWNQIVTDKAVYDPSGYDQIESVDDTNPKVAVATFKAPFASWSQLFAADYGVFPSHILQGKDRDKEMKNGYDWSGGPWFAKWDKGVSVTLTPNPKYYGPNKPKLKKIVFKILADTAAEFQAFKSGEVLAIYPQPEPEIVSSLKDGVEGTNSSYTADTANVEALWINNEAAPFASVPVRKAFAYSIDRDAIVAALFGDLGVTKAWQSLNPPLVGRYADKQAYSQYVPNPAQVNSLMTGDGWTKSGGYWTKNGKTAAFTIKSTAGNKRREQTEEILQEQLKNNGFKLSIKNPSADDLFGTILAAGDYQVSLYAQTALSLNPGNCAIMCSKNIPTKQNKQTGQNWTRTNIPELDPLLETVDTDINEANRIAASKASDGVMAANQVTLPLDPLPDIVLWSKRIDGPVGDNPLLSMFWNMNEWSLNS